METLPLFSSHYSGTILTLDKPPDKTKAAEVEDYESGAKSIIQLAVDNQINPVFVVESNLSGFIKGYKNCKENGLKLRFGLRLVVCTDMKDKSPESLKTEHKVIVFAKDSDGYERLLKISSAAATQGFYYRPRIDAKTLEKFWNKKDLILGHPFYHSFLHRNLLYFANCQPNYNFAENVFFLEKNDLPFNYLIEDAVHRFCNGKGMKVPTQSIYYEKNEDFRHSLAFKCLHERTTLDKPNQDHYASNQFSFENWLKKEKK